jgi:hypothetical protein
MQELIVNINDEGVISYVKSNDAPAFEGEYSQRRASNVLPIHPLKFAPFIFLRWLFGDRGRVSEWTRAWKGPHIVQIVGGPELGPFKSRQEALEYEVQWLLENRF